MSIFDSIILGVIEGLTEYLPISSTGHLILAARVFGLASTDFLKSFEISIQLGAIAAVGVLYGRTFLFDRAVLKKIAVAFAPTAFFGFFLYSFIKDFLFENTSTILWALFLGGIVFIVFEFFHTEKNDVTKTLGAITYRQAFGIGLAQSVSVIPGVSRAGATIIGGLCAGLDRKTIVEFSFLLAVPTMIAAVGYDFLKNKEVFLSADAGLLFAGFAASFFVALAAVRLFVRYIAAHRFTVFGVYRIVLAILFWIIFW